jgi:hypothetical protein
MTLLLGKIFEKLTVKIWEFGESDPLPNRGDAPCDIVTNNGMLNIS